MRFTLALAGLVALFSRSQAINLLEAVAATEDLSILGTAVGAAGLGPTLEGEGPFTVFAPTNSSFAALPPGLVTKLLEPAWTLHLQDVLLYHVTSGNVSSTDLSNGMVVPMANDETVNITIGAGVFVNGAEVVVPDIFVDNGVAHIINAVLTPSFLSLTIVDIASAATTTLAQLVVRAGLDDDLSATDGAFTVFAPTNDAFSALDESLVSFLTSDEGIPTLVSTLTYHVIPSVVPSVGIADGTTEVPSLEGTNLSIVKSSSGIRINDAANVVLESADVLAVNGIVHVIDSVLLVPEGTDATMAPTESSANSVTLAFGASAILAIMVAVL